MNINIAKRLLFFVNRSRSAKYEQKESIDEKNMIFLCVLCVSSEAGGEN